MVSFKAYAVFTHLVESRGCDRFLNRTSSRSGTFLLKYQLCVSWPCGKTLPLACSQGLNDLDKPSVSDRLGLRKGWRFLRQSQYHTFGNDNKQSLSDARHHVRKRPPLPSCFFFFLPYFSSTLLLQAYTPFINWAHSAGNTARLSSRTHLACNQ